MIVTLTSASSVDLTLDPLPNSVIKKATYPESYENVYAKDQSEMPGVMALIAEYSALKPLKGIRLAGNQHLTNEIATCVEAYASMGAQLRWASTNPFSTTDEAATYLTIKYPGLVTVFAWKGETIDEYWWCIYQTLTWPDGKGPNTLHDDGCQGYRMLHFGKKLEDIYEKTGKISTLEELEIKGGDDVSLYNLLVRVLKNDPKHWTKMTSELVGVSEQTTSGVTYFKNLYKKEGLLCTAFCCNDSVTKNKFDNIYGTRHSGLDGLFQGADVLCAGKEVVVIGHGQVGKGVAEAFRAIGSRVRVTEVDPICALQAAMQGYDVVLLDDVLPTADIVITTTGSIKTITPEHMLKMKDGAIVGNLGQGGDIMVPELLAVEGVKKVPLGGFVDKYILPNGNGIIILAEGRCYNLALAGGHPSFVLSTSCCSQIISQIELAKNMTSKAYDRVPIQLPKVLDEKIARLHLDHLNIKLTKLTQEQADYIGVPVEGPYKEENYKY